VNRCEDCGGPLTPDGADHIAVPLTSEYGVHAHVDEGIVALVAACWDMGITTTSSCQGGGSEPASLGFGPDAAERFARAVTVSATPEELEARPDDDFDWGVYEHWHWQPG